jgi:hypothetical protein
MFEVNVQFKLTFCISRITIYKIQYNIMVQIVIIGTYVICNIMKWCNNSKLNRSTKRYKCLLCENLSLVCSISNEGLSVLGNN